MLAEETAWQGYTSIQRNPEASITIEPASRVPAACVLKLLRDQR